MHKFLRSQLGRMQQSTSYVNIEAMRKRQETLGRFMARSYKSSVNTKEIEFDKFKAAMLTPCEELSEGVILYLHGGGYVAGEMNYAKGFGTVLCARLGIRVLCVAYRLAPEHLFPAALEDATEAYRYLLSMGFSPDRIILCGESAGGGLCYILCQELAKRGRTMPAGIIAISPWTDFTASGASYETNKTCDPSMTGEKLKFFADLYLYGATGVDLKQVEPFFEENAELDRENRTSPLVSPIFGSFEGLPPSLIFVGGDEIMLDDALSVAGRLKAAGVPCEVVAAPEMWHGYVLYCLKEHSSDFDKMAKFIKLRVSGQKKLRWMSLDNAAKIFPASRRRNWNNIFRLSATLTESVDTEVLHSALDVTLRRFPSMAVHIKTGFFWYYLEELPSPPDIIEEKPYPLAGMPFSEIKRCAFRVIVYDRRIAVEFYHAITDGSGALIFLKSLLAEYLYQKKGLSVPAEKGVLDRLEAPLPEETEDSFFKYAGPKKAKPANEDAYKISGRAEPDGFKTNTTFIFNAREIHDKARQRGVTVTAFMAAILTVATIRIQEKRVADPRRYKPIKIHIPINLRKLFPSKTLRNFFLYVRTVIDPRLGEYTFDEICKIIAGQMTLEITQKNMAAYIAKNVGSEKPMISRIAPLFLKNFIMRMVFLSVGERKSSFSFSNLGIVDMPEELRSSVERMDFVLGVQSSAPYNTAAVTFGDKLYFNIIRNISEPVLEAEIYRVLCELGIEHRVESNTREEGI